jgi:hypothetical protein
LAKTVRGSALVAVCGAVADESVALTLTLKAPELVGIPLIAPLLVIAIPGGNPEAVQLIGGMPPNEDTELL